jgi:hypothetical protein
MRALAVVVACCIGCSTGLPNTVAMPDGGGDGNGDSGGNGAADLAGADLGAPHDLAGADLTPDPTAPPLHLIVQTVPATSPSGKSFTVAFQVLDENNAPVNISRPVSIALGVHPSGAVLTGSTTVVASNSVATFSVSLDHWGDYTLIATTPDAPPSETPVVHVQGTQLAWLTQPTTAVAHQAMTPSPRVGIVDITGAVDTTATGQVSIWTTASTCQGYLVGTTLSPITAGVASLDDVRIDKACSGYRLQVTGSYPITAPAILSDPFDVIGGAPAQLTLQMAVTRGFASRDQPFDLVAHVLDAGGNDVALATTVTLSISPTAPLGGTTSAMTSGTTATFAGVTVGVAGNFTFQASAPGLTPGSLSLMVSPWQWRGTSYAPILVDPTTPDTIWNDGYPWMYSGQLARSTDQGATWTPIGAIPTDTPLLAIDPSVPATIYGSTYNETWKSTDGGQTVSNLPLTGGPFQLTIDASSSSRVYAVSATNVWKSVDGGAHFSAITPSIGSNMTTLTVDPTNGANLYVSGDGIWRSTDGGATWAAANGLDTSSDGYSRVAVNPSQPSRLVACASSGCYRSSDSGETFAHVYNGYLGYNTVAVAFDPATPTMVYACGNQGMVTSSDGGASFTPVALYPSDVYYCAIAPSSPSTLYITNGDGTWVTTTGGN